MKIQKVKDAVKKYPRIAIALMMMLLVGTGLGAWLMSSSDDYDASVTSTGGVTSFSVGFDDLAEMDTTDGAQSDSTTATIENLNGDRNIKMDITVTKNDTVDECTDYEDDCNVTFEVDSIARVDQEEFILSAGDTDIVSTLDCVALSCEHSLNIEVFLTDLGEALDTTNPVVDILVDLPQGFASGTIYDESEIVSVTIQVRNYPDDVVLLASKPCTFDDVAGTFECSVTSAEMGGWTSANIEVTATDEVGNSGSDVHEYLNWS